MTNMIFFLLKNKIKQEVFQTVCLKNVFGFSLQQLAGIGKNAIFVARIYIGNLPINI